MISTTHSELEQGPFQRSDTRAKTFIRWGIRHNTVLTIAVASVAPVLYLLFIDRFATNAFSVDDWSVVPFVHAAIHGHFSLGPLWSQYYESRLFMGSMILVLFGLVDRLDLRSVMFCSATLFIASYAGLLVLVRRYLGRALTPIPVLLTGVVWFSLADVQNQLWAFQISWYLTVFFFVMMLVFLLAPNGGRMPWVALAIVAAIVASLSTVQGFLCWPLGAICILWNEPWARRTYSRIALWLSAMLITGALYLHGYKFSEGNVCLARVQCDPNSLLHHPLTTLQFYLSLIGNIIPGQYISANPVHNATRFEVVGVALIAGAVFIVIQSWRHRASTEHLPLPLLLIVFSMLFDVTITVGRGGMGPFGAVDGNRFVMANLILLTGIVIYSWAHIPIRHLSTANGPVRVWATYVALVALSSFLVLQATVATGFGLMNGRVIKSALTAQAQVIVNAEREHVSSNERLCQLFASVFFVIRFSALPDAVADQLGEFGPNAASYYRALGFPPAPASCKPSIRPAR